MLVRVQSWFCHYISDVKRVCLPPGCLNVHACGVSHVHCNVYLIQLSHKHPLALLVNQYNRVTMSLVVSYTEVEILESVHAPHL